MRNQLANFGFLKYKKYNSNICCVRQKISYLVQMEINISNLNFKVARNIGCNIPTYKTNPPDDSETLACSQFTSMKIIRDELN